jgi:hypothetical protein
MICGRCEDTYRTQGGGIVRVGGRDG